MVCHKMADARFVLLDNRGILAVSGPDRRAFLQGLVSNDVGKVAATRAQYAALLTAQGKFLHDFIMIEVDEAIWLEVEADRVSDLKRRLTVYRLRSRVSLEERADLAIAAVFGEGALTALGLAGEPGLAIRFGEGVALTDPRLTRLGGRCILPQTQTRTALAAAGLAESTWREYESRRIRLGIPDGSRDLALEKSILLEAGFDELNGVDWQKGCYVGQELTARTKYRGLVRRRLMPVRIEGPSPLPGTIVTADGREVGEMRSVCEGLGLALLRIEPVLAGKKLQAAGAALFAEPPDWMHLPAGGDGPE
jgi:folate-binding protein YgfZ